MNTPNISQKAQKMTSTEKYSRKCCRMIHDFTEIRDNLHRRPRKEYDYTDANRDRMRDILNNPRNFSVDEKIDTLLSFHKDTCANIMLRLYPSTGDEYDCLDAFEDLEILKRFEPVLVDLELEFQKTYAEHSYQHLRAKKQLMQMRVSMSGYLNSSDAAALPVDIKNWMLQKLECNDYSYDVCDDDEERLEGLKRGMSGIIAHLQRLGVDTSECQDRDDGDQYLNFQPTRDTIDEYMLLEKELTRMHDNLTQLSEDAHPFDQYLESLKSNVGTLQSVVNEDSRKSLNLYRRQIKSLKLYNLFTGVLGLPYKLYQIIL